MEFRSSNHGLCSPKDIQSNVGSSHGIHLSGGSTGGKVEPCGDDANIALRLYGKGTGTVFVGNSSNAAVTVAAPMTVVNTVTISTGTVVMHGSTAPFLGHVRVESTGVATPNFNSTGLFGIVSTHTVAGVNSSHFVLANATNLSTAIALSQAWAGSTAGSINLQWHKLSTVTIAASTATVRFLIFRF